MGYQNPERNASGMPKRDFSFQRVQVYSTAPATEENKAHERYGSRFEMIKQRYQSISCLFGTVLLRTGRPISDEASHVL